MPPSSLASPDRLAAWPLVSVVVPACNEAENVSAFVADVAALRERVQSGSLPFALELVVVNDGSTDATGVVLAQLQQAFGSWVRVATHRSRRGIAAALTTAAQHAGGSIHVFYPADRQFDPADIPALVLPILADRADVVTGAKRGVYEKAFVSGWYNRLARALFAIPVTDMNSVKAYRAAVLEGLTLRPDWHRFLVALAHLDGWRLAEVPVTLYPRQAGVSKFTWRRIPVGIADLVATWVEWRFGQKPLLLFGGLGLLALALAAVSTVLGLTVLAMAGTGARWFWMLVQTLWIIGALAVPLGILGEQVAMLRAEVRRAPGSRSDVP